MGYPDPCQRLKASITVADDDSAASNGTALRIIQDPTGKWKFISENANNANSSFNATITGPDKNATEVATFQVEDVAAGTGVAVFVDEDYADGSKRFLAVVPTLGDAFVEGSNGAMIQIRYMAATTSGVAVYFDDNGGTATERLLFVSPTNADATVTTSNERCGVFQIPGA